MKARQTLLVFVMGFVATSSTNACPACNIYNYLAGSVVQSSNVVVGKLAARVDVYNVKVEVVRTLHGSLRPGQTVEMKAWTKPEDTGRLFIFSDPWDEPSFPILGIEFEDEVRFLLRLADLEKQAYKGGRDQEWEKYIRVFPETVRRYKVSDADEAIRRVQGWSNESKEVGMDYLHKYRPFPTRKIIDAIEPIKNDLLAGREVPSALNRLGNLVEALMLSDDRQGEDYMLAQVRSCLEQKERALDWSKLPIAATPRGEWLAELLGLASKEWTHRLYAGANPYRKTHSALAEKEKQMVQEALLKLQGMLLSEAVYAVYETGGSTAEQLLALLKEFPNKDEFALGVLWSAGSKVHPWYGEKGSKPLVDLELIAPLATRPELQKQISERIEFARRWRVQSK